MRIRKLLAVFTFISFTFYAEASHLLGGEITYVFLDQNGPPAEPFRYRIRVEIYVDRIGNPPSDPSQFPSGILGAIPFRVFNANGSFYKTFTVSPATFDVNPNVPPGCSVPGLSGISIKLNVFEAIVNLPITFTGFYIGHSVCCRSAAVNNLQTPQSQSNIYTAFIPASIYRNSSPQFSDLALPFICSGDTTTVINNAVDPDGDKLIYSLVAPGRLISGWTAQFLGTVPVNYASGFTATQPFGINGFVNIDASSGLTEYYSAVQGNFTVAFEVKEYRNINGTDVLLSSTIREMQLTTRLCSPNPSPVFTSGGSSSTIVYNIEEGDSIGFVVSAQDPNNDTIEIKATSVILTGGGGYTGPLANMPIVTGKGSASTTFTWKTACGFPGSYAVNVSVADKGCPPKTQNRTYLINVASFNGVDNILGQDSVCFSGVPVLYTINSQNPNIIWQATNGNIIGNPNNDSISVLWNGVGAGFLKVNVSSGQGCTDSALRSITIAPLTVVDAGADKVICAGDSVQLAASGATIVSWSPSGSLSNPNVVNPFAKPVLSTTYVVDANSNIPSCASKDSVTVFVFQQFEAAGANQTICEGDSALIGVSSVPGYSYKWISGTGILDTSTAQTFVKPNVTGLNDYIVRVTNDSLGCVWFDTVTISLNSKPIADAGTNDTICSGESIIVGTSALSGFSYLWQSSGSLSNDTIAQPTFQQTISGTVPQVSLLLLRVEDIATSCFNFDTIAITVFPNPKPDAGTDKLVCAGDTTLIGSSPESGQIYSWSPITGVLTSGSSNTLVTFPSGSGTQNLTYVLTRYDSVFGCMNSDSMLINLFELPPVDAGSDQEFCSGSSVTIGGAGLTGLFYLWTPSQGLSDNLISNPTASLTNNGSSDSIVTYILLSTNGVTTCINFDTVELKVKPIPIAEAGIDTTLCKFDSIQIGGAATIGYSYVWTGSSNLNNPNSSSPVFSASDSTSVLVVQTILNGCENFDTVTVTVIQPVADAGQDESYCSLDSTLIGSAGISGYSYLWTPDSGLSNDTLSLTTLSLINTDTTAQNLVYVIKATNNLYSCVSFDTVRVILNALPQVNAGNDDSICSGNSKVIGALPRGGWIYQWTPPGFLSNPNASDPSFTAVNLTGVPQVVNLIVQAIDTNTTCRNFDSVSIVVNPNIKPDAGPDRIICSGDTAQLGAATLPGFTYLWTPATGLTSNAIADPLVTRTVSAQQNFNYFLLMTNQTTTCFNRDTIVLTVRPKPVTNAGPDNAICSGENLQIGQSPQSNRAYLWTPSFGLSATNIASPTVNIINTTDTNQVYQYILRVTNTANTCINFDTINITIKPYPIAEAGEDTTLCPGANVVLGAAPRLGYSYSWSPVNGLSGSAQSNPTLTLDPSFTMDSLYYVVTVDRESCISVDSVKVRIIQPVADAGADKTICSGDTIAIGTNPIPDYIYEWIPGEGFIDSLSPNTFFTFINSGTSPVQRFLILKATNIGFSCVSFDTMQVTINDLPVVNNLADVIFCSGDTIVIDPNPVASGITPTWTPGTGIILPSGSVTTTAITLINAGQGQFNQTYIVQLENNSTFCRNRDTVEVSVNPLPIADAGLNATACSGDTITTGSTNISTNTYSWISSNGLLSTTISNPQFSDTLPNGFNSDIRNLVVLVTDTLTGCINLDTVSITLFSRPVADAGSDVLKCPEDTIMIGSGSLPGLVYNWIVGSGLNNFNISNPLVFAGNPGSANLALTYVVLVVNQSTGCNNYDTIVVTVKPAPDVDAGPDVAFCSGDTVLIGSAPLANVNYQWNPGQTPVPGISNSTISNPTITLSTIAQPDTSFYVLRGEKESCLNYDTVRVIVNPRPDTVVISGGKSICPGATGIQYSIAGLPGYTYNWTITGGTLFSGQGNQSIFVNWGATNPNAMVQVYPINNFGCGKDTSKLNVDVNPILATQTPIGLDTICFNSAGNITYQISNTNGSVYTWGVSNGTILSGNGSNVVNVQWNSAGTGTIWIIETAVFDTVCLGVSDTLAVSLLPNPDANIPIVGNMRACEFSTGLSYGLNGLPGSTFVWNVTGGAITSGQNTNQINVNWGSATSIPHTISVIETSQFGCPGSLIDTILLVQPLPVTNLSANNSIVCPTLLDSNRYIATGLPGSSYFWYVPNGLIAGGNGNDTVIINWFDSTVKEIFAYQISSFGCIGDTAAFSLYTDRVNLKIHSITTREDQLKDIEVNFNVFDFTPQQANVNVFRRTRADNPEPWTLLTSVFPAATNFPDLNKETSKLVYEYKVETRNLCNVLLSPPIHNSILLSGEAIPGASTSKLQWNAYINWEKPVERYEIWRKRDTDFTFSYYDKVDGNTSEYSKRNGTDALVHQYRILAIEDSSDAFSWSNIITIFFENPITTMNTVTANGDGKNDTWIIENIHLYPDNEVIVYNRWGREVFRKSGYNNEWDGKDIPTGLYTYEVTILGGQFKQTGYLQLMD